MMTYDAEIVSCLRNIQFLFHLYQLNPDFIYGSKVTSWKVPQFSSQLRWIMCPTSKKSDVQGCHKVGASKIL